MAPPAMATTGAGLSVLVLDGPGVEELVVVPEPEPVSLLVPVGDVIAKDRIVDRFGSLKPPLGAVLVAPPFSLYGEGRSEIGSGKREGRGRRRGELKWGSRN